MEVKEAFHKWANGGKTLVAYGPRDEGGYSLLEYNSGPPKELFRSDSLEEIQAAFRNYYAVKAQVENGMPWKVAGNHLTPEFFSLKGSGGHAQDQSHSGIRR